MKEQIKKFNARYESETKDMLFLVEAGCCGAVVKDGCCFPNVKFLASYNPVSKEFSEEKGFLDWISKENRRRSGWGHRFCALTVYRVRVSRLIPAESAGEAAKNFLRPELNGNRYRIVKVLGRARGDKCEQFAGIIRHYQTPVVLESPIYGTFTLVRRNGQFENMIAYGESELSITLATDTRHGETADCAFETLHRLYPDIAAADERLKKHAAAELTGLANDWSGCDEGEEGGEDVPEGCHHITEEEFARRIDLCLLMIDSDGSAEAIYGDDGMFWEHSVVVRIDSEGNPGDADLWG